MNDEDKNLESDEAIAKSDLNRLLGGKSFCRRNAEQVVKELLNDEWKFIYNSLSNSHLTAHKDGRELWIGNGSFFVI